MSDNDICMSCGACCATWPIYFNAPHAVPEDKFVKCNKVLFRMTADENKRCTCLGGTIGNHVMCNIYESRSTTCRTFDIRSDRCNEARKKHGLSII